MKWQRVILFSWLALAAACSTDVPEDGKPSNQPDVGQDGGHDDAAKPEDTGAGEDTPALDCVDGTTQEVACGLNGRGTASQTCVAGSWGEPAACADPDVCADGAEQEGPCGRNGRGSIAQACVMGGWVDDGACADPDDCTDAESRTVACGLNGRGTQTQTCLQGAWDDSAVCADPDPCTDGASRSISCGLNDRGSLAQDCVLGDWQDSGACVDPDACTDGTSQSVACGLNDRGLQQQDCVAGAWADVGGCTGTDVCVDGATQTVSCGFNNNGAQDQLCVTGSWSNQGGCVDPDTCTNGTTQQIACGFDGVQEQSCASGAWVDVGACVESVVAYCLTRPATVGAVAGQPSGAIEGVVYVDQKTGGVGTAAGVIGRVVWGPVGDAPATWQEVAPGAYLRDEDGLVPGDLANDVWQAAITSPTAGDFGYAFQFSADNGATWQLCDTIGTEDGMFDPGAVGLLQVALPPTPDDCRLQFPQLIEAAAPGTPIAFYGRVIEPGVTGAGTNPSVVGQLLVGPAGADPRPDAMGFTAIAGTFNPGALNLQADEEEYSAAFTPAAAGTFAVGWRFSVDGGTTWEYCGLRDGAVSTPAFEPVKLGFVRATAPSDEIDFCHIWQDTLSDDAGTSTQPTVTVEVYQGGVTDSNAMGDALEVEAAALALERNPALDATATWTALPYSRRRPGMPNNYEYEGTPYTAANHPAAGAYNVVVRVREAGTSAWTYCDTDDTAAEFRLESASRLTVTP